MGKPFADYEVEFQEVKKLGQGGMGAVMLVKRLKDGKYFASKKQLKDQHFSFAKKEL